MIKHFKRPLSIILAVLMVMSVFIAVPMTASALTEDDVESLLDSMRVVIYGYDDQNDFDHVQALSNYYVPLSQAFEDANLQVTPEVESAYNAAYAYFYGGSGVSYPNVNNVYMATDGVVEVTIADLQPGDVLVTSPDPLEVQKGECNIVLVGGTYGEGDVEEGTLFDTYPNDVTLGNELRFDFQEKRASIINMGENIKSYDPVYNNKLGNAYIVLGNDNGTVYLAGYNYTTYTITWKDYNGSNLYDGQSTVAAGTVPYYRWSVSRSSTAQYSYTFTGWTDSSNNFHSKDSELPAVTKDETYTATYTETLRSYTITWKDGNNETLKSESVAYGTTPSYTGETPTKTEDDDYTYEFNNTWSPSVASVTGNATYTAQFDATEKAASAAPTESLLITINSKGNSGFVSGSRTFNNIATVAFSDEVDNDDDSDGWYNAGKSNKILSVAPAAGYTITKVKFYCDDGSAFDETSPFEATLYRHEMYVNGSSYGEVGVNKIEVYGYATPTTTYTVTWKNGDTTLKTDTVDKDAIPVYNGTTPTKAADDSKHYTFSGWSNGTTTYGLNDTLPAVSGDVTYTAVFTEAAHTFNSNPVFNWTQDASTGDWDCNKLTLSCECGATQDTDVYGISFGGGAKTSAVKCTANADGSYTYSVTKKVGSTTYQDSKTVEANGVVYTANQLKAAAKLGGEWELGNDIAEVTGVSCADGFVLDGNNKTLSAHTFVKTSPMFKSANKTAEYTLKNLTIDGVAGETQSQPAISSATTSPGQTNVINLEGVTITNYDFDAANNGAVLAFGHAKVNLTNCKIDTDSQNDVWGGAASTINVSGGEVGALYLNGGTSTADLTNGAKVDTIKTATGSTVTAGSADMINPPAGYIVQDNGNGTYSIVVDPDPLALAPIIGFQKKITGNLSGNDIGTQGVRIITKVEDVDLTQFDEYGYVVAKVHGKEQATANFNNMKAYGGNGEKTIKCNGSVNTIDGYGTSYVTLAVNGMSDGDQVAARFYAIKNGVKYYSNYVSTARYNGIIATY